jgi:hypothetical protein
MWDKRCLEFSVLRTSITRPSSAVSKLASLPHVTNDPAPEDGPEIFEARMGYQHKWWASAEIMPLE